LVPELLQEQCRSDILADMLLSLLRDPGKAGAQREGFAAALASLRAPAGAPSDAAAQAILAVLNEPMPGFSLP
jgi:lipid-A-disaccharide synthase